MICRALDRYRAAYEKFGTELPPGRTEEYLDCLADHSTAPLEWALKTAPKRCTGFPTIAHIEGLIQEYRADHGAETRKNANCLRCEGIGWRYADPDNARAGVKPCDCRPAPPELASPRTPVEGLTHELAGEIAEAAAGRSMSQTKSKDARNGGRGPHPETRRLATA